MREVRRYVCQQCASSYPQWYGKCPNCDTWGSLVETVQDTPEGKRTGTQKTVKSVKPTKLSAVTHIESKRLKSDFSEFDRVMGGGIVPGSVTLLAGDPGIGKSTLLLHVLSAIHGLYIAGEESPEQVKLRAKRVGVAGDTIAILSETQVETILASLKEYTFSNSGLIIVDSIQTISSLELDGMPGSVGQIRYCAEQLTTYAKSHGVALIIIGHVNKEGSIAGPKVLEHLVDTVLYLEGERFVNARILRTLKNRFGPVEEVGIFDMTEKGLVEIANPSEVFLQDRVPNVAGSTVTVVLEGTRPLLVEVQALVVSSQLAMPRRVANGVDPNRLQLIIAILQKRLGLPLGAYDIFVNISGGYKITEPSADLAIALSIISSLKNCPLISNSVVYGELGLLGEIRMVTQKERRDKEAQRVGFTPLIQTAKRSNIATVVEKAFNKKNQV